MNNNINKNQENILDNNKIMNKSEKIQNKKNRKIIIYNNKENQINLKKENNKKNNNVKNKKIHKGYTEYLDLNFFARICTGKYSIKRKIAQLFRLSSLFYKKRMDIVTCFSRSLILEKMNLNDNNSYTLCKEMELIYPNQ